MRTRERHLKAPAWPLDIELALSTIGVSPFEPRKGAKPVLKATTATVHVVPPPIDQDTTVRAIAKILLGVSRFTRISSDNTAETNGLYLLLERFGISKIAVQMAVGLTSTEGGTRRGTAHVPNARLNGQSLTTPIKEVRDTEVYFRAAYLANAAQRMQRSLDAGATQNEALQREAPFYQLHEKARRGRLDSVAQVQRAAGTYGAPDPAGGGTMVGWYLNPLLNNEAECIAANGHNFIAEDSTVIGYPGSVHPNCGCYAGSPWPGAGMVNDVLSNVIKLQKTAKPKFKLKERRRA